MIRIFSVAFLFILSGFGCNKGSAGYGKLEGTWVEKELRLDTLVVYRSNGKDMMLDNSEAYRRYPVWASNYAFRSEFRLKGDKIGFRPAASGGDFIWYDFRWNGYDEFTMPYNGLRPYLSSIGDITYVKLR